MEPSSDALPRHYQCLEDVFLSVYEVFFPSNSQFSAGHPLTRSEVESYTMWRSDMSVVITCPHLISVSFRISFVPLSLSTGLGGPFLTNVHLIFWNTLLLSSRQVASVLSHVHAFCAMLQWSRESSPTWSRGSELRPVTMREKGSSIPVADSLEQSATDAIIANFHECRLT